MGSGRVAGVGREGGRAGGVVGGNHKLQILPPDCCTTIANCDREAWYSNNLSRDSETPDIALERCEPSAVAPTNNRISQLQRPIHLSSLHLTYHVCLPAKLSLQETRKVKTENTSEVTYGNNGNTHTH